jgi:hypothetical protein
MSFNSPYERTVKELRRRGSRNAPATLAVLLALAWVASVAVHTADHWHRHLAYVELLGAVDTGTAGIITLAALLWLYESLRAPGGG